MSGRDPIGGAVVGAAVSCPLSKPNVKIAYALPKRDDPTGVPGVRVTLRLRGGSDGAAYRDTNGSGIAAWSSGPTGITAGDYDVTVANLDANLYELDTRVLTIAARDFGVATIFVTKLARPKIEVGWGALLANKVEGVKIRLSKDGENFDTAPTAKTTGIFAFPPGSKGLKPGDYTVSLTDAKDRLLYTIDPTSATVTLKEGQTDSATIQILLKKLARPKIQITNTLTNNGISGVALKLVTVRPAPQPPRDGEPPPPPLPPAPEFLFGDSLPSGIAELPSFAAGLPVGSYDVVLTNDRYRATRVSPTDAITLTEGSTATIPRTVTPTTGALRVELIRNDGAAVKPISPATTIEFTTQKGTDPSVDRTAAPAAVKTVAEVGALAAGEYKIELKNPENLRRSQPNTPTPGSDTPVWFIGPEKDGKLTVPVEIGKTATASFTMNRYRQVQFIGLDIMPGVKDGYRCGTCHSLSENAGTCSVDAGHGARWAYSCEKCTNGGAAEIDCPQGHLQELNFYCQGCKKGSRSQGPCGTASCGPDGQFRPICLKCGKYVVQTTCVTCVAGIKQIPYSASPPIECSHTPKVRYTLPAVQPTTCPSNCVMKYKKAQVYLGRDTEEDDLGSRVHVMKAAIKQVYDSASIDKNPTGESILKVFMAPEFYFRGRQGAYSLDLVSTIMEQMAVETKDDKYKDWLFIYGTAISYIKHEDSARTDVQFDDRLPLRITNVVIGTTGSKVHVARRTAGDTSAQANVCERVPANNAARYGLLKWKLKQGTVTAVVNAQRKVADAAFEIKISTAGTLGTMAFQWRRGTGSGTYSPAITSQPGSGYLFNVTGQPCTLKFGPDNYQAGATYSIAADGAVTRNGSANDVVTAPRRGVLAKAVEIEVTTPGVLGVMAFKWRVGTDATWEAPVTSGTDSGYAFEVPGMSRTVLFAAGTYLLDSTYAIATNGTVTKSAPAAPAVSCPSAPPSATEEYELELAGGAWRAADCSLVEPDTTEILNVALVQKGGSGTGVAGLKELLVYKEAISSIDFLGPNYSDKGWFRPSGEGRQVYIYDHYRLVLPTAGSGDLLTQDQNRASEVTKTGLGGGSVFTVDGITFGVEVCLDHANNKLRSFYDGAPPKGSPKVQVQLIPSWGMSIGGGDRCGVTNALLFNVDGPNGSAAGILTAPNTDQDGKKGTWNPPVTGPTTVTLPTLATTNWTIKIIDPAAHPPALKEKSITAATYAGLFQKATNIKVFPLQTLPPAEAVP